MTAKKLHQLTGHNAAIFALAEGRDERHFLSASGDGWVAEWNFSAPETGKLIAQVDVQIFCLRLLKSNGKLVAGNMNGGVHWIDLEAPENTKNIAHHQKGVFQVLETEGSVFTAGGEGKITRWSVGESRSLESYHLANQAIRCLDYSPKRNEIAAGSSDGSIYMLDETTLELKQVIRQAHQSSVFSVRYHPTLPLLLSGGRDAQLNVWNLDASCEKASSQSAHWYTINDLVFHPEGLFFATASRDKSIKIWDAQTFELVKVLEAIRDGGHVNSVNCLFWSTYNHQLVSCSDDRSILIWEIESIVKPS